MSPYTELIRALAGKQPDLEKAEELIDGGLDVNYTKPNSFSLLVGSMSLFNNVGSVELLLNKGADPNIVDENGSTPLHYAATRARVEILKLLLQHGAAVNHKDNHGNTPLSAISATWDEAPTLISLLLDHGADPSSKNNYGVSVKDHLLNSVAADRIAHLLG